MRLLFTAFVVLALTGCAQVKSWVPSFWDDNQSSRIIDARLTAEQMDCASDQISQQVAQLNSQLLWFELYSESKGWRQQDVIKLIHPIRETVTDMQKRYREGQATKGYCEIKQRIIKSQLQRAAEAVLGRY